jgi:hypothetical protein
MSVLLETVLGVISRNMSFAAYENLYSGEVQMLRWMLSEVLH